MLIDGIQIKQVQTVDALRLIAGHIDIIHHGMHRTTAERHRKTFLPADRPGRLRDPGIFDFVLQTVFQLLFKQTEVIVQTDPVSGEI